MEASLRKIGISKNLADTATPEFTESNTNYQYILVQSCDVIFCQDDLKKSLHSQSLRNYFFKKYW